MYQIFKEPLQGWVLEHARVVFCTVSKSGSAEVRQPWGTCTVAIIDEAAMVLESETHIVLQVGACTVFVLVFPPALSSSPVFKCDVEVMLRIVHALMRPACQPTASTTNGSWLLGKLQYTCLTCMCFRQDSLCSAC